MPYNEFFTKPFQLNKIWETSENYAKTFSKFNLKINKTLSAVEYDDNLC